MEVVLKLSEENIQAIAQAVYKLQNENSPKVELDRFEQTYTVNEVAKITNKHFTTILRHIKLEPPLLIAKKSGKNYTVTYENLNSYIGKTK